MIRLNCVVQSYSWGKPGSTSAVAQLLSAADQSFTVEANAPYAELWMGTHPKGESIIWGDAKKSLSNWLAENANGAGEKLCEFMLKESEKSNKSLSLPFLFKILSVQQALSIQVHPTKDQAVLLHLKDPGNYPDPNHKPEMCIALTPFEVLCGFRPAKQIYDNIKETPELFELIGSEPYQALEKIITENKSDDSIEAKDALKACFSSLMLQPEPLIQRNIASVADRIALTVNTKQKDQVKSTLCSYELLLRLNYQYPGDIGFFMPFFLNHFTLQPGEACFLGPNEPHAYLFGDCIECMACSDNTIRAGLTPKFKDIVTLVNSLTYNMTSADIHRVSPNPHPLDPNTTVYDPPVPEFVVHRIQVPCLGKYTIPATNSCSIMIVLDGICSMEGNKNVNQLSKGFIVLVAANQSQLVTVSKAPFIAYRAFCDIATISKL